MAELAEEIQEHFQYILDIAANDGPDEEEFDDLTAWFKETLELKRAGAVSAEQIRGMWDLCGDAFSLQTIQGLMVKKPHGYAGDFEIIDRIHTKWLSPLPHLRQWDVYWHATAAPKAVRNRVEFFHNILHELESSAGGNVRVLNVGSGPGRDLQKYFATCPSSKIIIDCVDMDEKAIAYAQDLTEGFEHCLNWYCKNIFRFKTNKRYDLVWSAGVFDYLSDRHFSALLKHLCRLTKPGGQLVVGNFSPLNPTRFNMELGEWLVNHRDEGQLMELAVAAGLSPEQVRVVSEPLGVNLFLEIQVA
ncbi:MAG: class I SAM-dependent methyltransferase [Thermodesulfobacteriota bacterium]